MVFHIPIFLTALLIAGGLISTWKTSDKRAEERNFFDDLYIPIPPPPPKISIPIRHFFQRRQFANEEKSHNKEERGFQHIEPVVEPHVIDLGQPHHHHHARSELLYILPLIIVIGIGSFLIPIMSTFFTAVLSNGSGCCRKRKKSNFKKDNLLKEIWDNFRKAFFNFDSIYGPEDFDDSKEMVIPSIESNTTTTNN